MSYSRRSRYSYDSPSPYRERRSFSRSLSRSRSRSRSYDSSDVENPGNNLYVTGLSSRVRTRDLEKHFSNEGGKVVDVHLVVDPWTRESRGFGFVTMETVGDANRCIKYLDGSVLEGRVITVEKARRRRGRTPTPGRYLGAKTIHVRRRSPSYSPYRRGTRSPCSSERGRSYSPYYYRQRSSRSRRYSSDRERSYSPCYSRREYRYRSPSYYSPERDHYRSYSPYYDSYRRSGRRYSYSPDSRHRSRSFSRRSSCERRYRSYSRKRSPSPPYYRSGARSPSCRRDERTVSPYSGASSRSYSRSP